MWIKDENNVMRKHRETIRKPFDGETVKIITDLYEDDGVPLAGLMQISHKGDETYITTNSGEIIYLHSGEYVVLEETEIIRLNDTDYREITRKVCEGDLIYLLRGNVKKGFTQGQVLTVVKVQGELLTGYDTEKEETYTVWAGEFIGMEPLQQSSTVEKRLLRRFDTEQLTLLASDLPLEDVFKMVLHIETLKKGIPNL